MRRREPDDFPVQHQLSSDDDINPDSEGPIVIIGGGSARWKYRNPHTQHGTY